MDKRNQIDDLFRERLGSYEPEFVPEHWQMMKSAIANPRNAGFKNSGTNFTNIIIIISAIFLVSTGIITYVLSERDRQAGSGTAQLAMNTLPANHVLKTEHHPKTTSPAFNSESQKEEKSTQQVHRSTVPEKGLSAGNLDNTTALGTSAAKALKKNPVIEKKAVQFAAVKDPGSIPSFEKNISFDQRDFVKDEENFEVELATSELVDQSYVNGVKIDQNPIHPDEDQAINSTSKAVINEKSVADTLGYSSVIDDYNAENAAAGKKQNRKNSTAKNKIMEAVPDYKVGVVNNFAVNPAYTGFNQRHTINVSTMVYKPLYKPGNDFNVPFEYRIAYDFNFGKRKNCGIGANYRRFIGGAEGLIAVDVTFSYRFNLAKYHNLRVGASVSYYSSDINKDNLSFPDMIDENHGFVFGTSEVFSGRTTKNNLDLGVGVWYSWKSLYVGVSAIHLTSPDIGVISSNNIPREYLLAAGYNYKISDKFGMLPALELKYNERILNFTPGMLFTYRKWLLFGTEFKNLTNAGLVLGFNIKDNVIINIHSGVPMKRIIMDNFGIMDYAGINVRLQF